jgi:uncharacterized OB-fold protein
MVDEGKETREVSDTWDLSLYKWKIEIDGQRLLLEGLKDKKILGRKCNQCGTVYVPGVSYCRKCFIDIEQVVEVGTQGEVATFTVNLADVRGNPLENPQVICNFKLKGSDSWIMGSLQVDDWHKVKVGMPVKIHFLEHPTGALADIEYFEPL